MILTSMLLLSTLLVFCSSSGDHTQDEESQKDGGGDKDGDKEDELETPAQGNTQDSKKYTRKFIFRGVGGISMGATSSLMIALKNPTKFDLIYGMGGYHNLTFLHHYFSNRIFSGFCPRKQILKHLNQVNQANNPNVYCAHLLKREPGEMPYDFNNFYFNNNGDTFHRTFTISAMQDISTALGNSFYYNRFNFYTPPGVPAERLLTPSKQRCKNPLTFTNFYNREYNPDGKYPVITFCDGEESIAAEKESEEWYEQNGKFDPTREHHFPIETILAVDYNQNGKRDYGEPLVINAMERYNDIGKDGLPDEKEPGYQANKNPDPAGDNYHYLDNPGGTEDNHQYDPGEPYDDFGLDGVDCDIHGGACDYGEGNYRFDISPNLEYAITNDSYSNLKKLTKQQLWNLSIYIDAGIYDFFNTMLVSNHFIGLLKQKNAPIKIYDRFTSLPAKSQYSGGFSNTSFASNKVDYRKLGRYSYLRYGNPNASQEDIRNGEGGHLGTIPQLLYRYSIAHNFISYNWPDGDWKKTEKEPDQELEQYVEIYSKSLEALTGFYVIIPPGYYRKENLRKTYPVLYSLHGIGMDIKGMKTTGLINASRMAAGTMAKMIQVFSDGKCCLYHPQEKKRHCLLKNEEYSHLDSKGYIKECNKGSFYLNARGKWREGPKYEDALFEIMDYIEKNYRVKPEGVYPVDAQGNPLDIGKIED